MTSNRLNSSLARLALLAIIVFVNIDRFFSLFSLLESNLPTDVMSDYDGDDGIEQQQELPYATSTTANNYNDNYNDKNCLRFATIDIDQKQGLGHRFAELVMGMNLARATNASFVYQTEHWSRGKPQVHGRYEWWNEFFPLQDTPYATSAGDLLAIEAIVGDHALSIYRGNFDHLVEVSQDPTTPRCNVMFIMRGLWACCPGKEMTKRCWCTFYEERIGAYDSVKDILREVYKKHTRYVPQNSPLALPPGEDIADVAAADARVVTVSVAWHVRLGDINLNRRRDFFLAIANHVAEAFRDANGNTILANDKKIFLRPHVFLFGTGGKSRIQQIFPFVAEVCREYFGDRCTYQNTDPRDTLWGMIHSDVLITSGSSFPILATELRTRGIVLAAMPKEGRHSGGVYRVSEQVDIDGNGNIPGISKLQDFLVEEDWAK